MQTIKAATNQELVLVRGHSGSGKSPLPVRLFHLATSTSKTTVSLSVKMAFINSILLSIR